MSRLPLRHALAQPAFEVGYESPNQFSREYARAFGLAPAQDSARILGNVRAPRMPA